MLEKKFEKDQTPMLQPSVPGSALLQKPTAPPGPSLLTEEDRLRIAARDKSDQQADEYFRSFKSEYEVLQARLFDRDQGFMINDQLGDKGPAGGNTVAPNCAVNGPIDADIHVATKKIISLNPIRMNSPVIEESEQT